MGVTQAGLAFHITQGAWQEHRSALTAVRCAVFVVEQGVPVSLELDEFDTDCHHILVTDHDGQPVGAGRIKPDGHIGRMAVLKDCRGQGVGSAIMSSLLDYAREQGRSSVFLHAQLSAVSFYETFGFVASGDVFDEAGIPHRRMEMTLE